MHRASFTADLLIKSRRALQKALGKQGAAIPILADLVCAPGADIEDIRANGNAQFFEGFDHVTTKAIFVGERRTRAENASVDLVIEMLEESADDHQAVFN